MLDPALGIARPRMAGKLARVGDELAGDRVFEILLVDQPRERRRQADRISLSDRFELGDPFGGGESRRRAPGGRRGGAAP